MFFRRSYQHFTRVNASSGEALRKGVGIHIVIVIDYGNRHLLSSKANVSNIANSRRRLDQALPNLESLPLPSNFSIMAVPGSNVSYARIVNRCSPNPTQHISNCTIKCEIPRFHFNDSTEIKTVCVTRLLLAYTFHITELSLLLPGGGLPWVPRRGDGRSRTSEFQCWSCLG